MASRRAALLLAAVATGLWALGVMAEEDWTQCPMACKCKWISGKKASECINASLTTVPSGLSSQIQSLSLSGNSISELHKDAFSSLDLRNLHKLYLHDCHIKRLDSAAFRGLTILIELDLSNNEITKLLPGTFRDTVKLRVINLQRNQITRLEDNLFTNLIFLQKIDLSNCQLKHIGHKTFHNVTKLSQIFLEGNKLTHIKPETFLPLVELSYLVLRNNPWHCDCQLKEFHLWMTSKNMSIDASCMEPMNLHGQTFSSLKSNDFDCYFKISHPSPGTTIRSNSGNISLNCQVVGYPRPNFHWVYNSRIVETYGERRYVVSKGGDWANLTIIDTQDSDQGTYTCVANGSGILAERHVKLLVGGATLIPGDEKSDLLWLIIGLIIGALLLFIIVIVLFCCFCRRTRPTDKKGLQSDGGMGPNGDANSDTEQAKSLLVNPVQKPPRRAEMQPLVTNSSTTQLSSMKGPFMDNGSVFLGGSSDERTLDRSSDSMDTQRDDSEPPDLLSFPSRGSQVSPAGSTASTAPDSTRLPVQSPMHHYAQSLCGTLPHSRSQSPFTPVVMSRPGYVTIPRRPRVPSWSSMPASSPVGFPPDPSAPFKLEPVYDNLGVRTTADGSSVLSLNKIGGEQTPMRGRPLPPTPVHYAPIQETELQASPMLSRASNRSTPNISATPNRTSPEGAFLHRPEEKTPAVNGHAGGRSGQKVPPKPPPKPKKKKTSDLVSPLYEDEGEDGTEV